MEDSGDTQNRRSRRSNLLMSASIEISGLSLPVKLRNLSAEGALIEADKLPVEGAKLLFRKAEISIEGRLAWVEGKRGGVEFVTALCPETVLRHVPTPRPRVQFDFRRPGVGPKRLTLIERQMGESWAGATTPE